MLLFINLFFDQRIFESTPAIGASVLVALLVYMTEQFHCSFSPTPLALTKARKLHLIAPRKYSQMRVPSVWIEIQSPLLYDMNSRKVLSLYVRGRSYDSQLYESASVPEFTFSSS